MKKYEKPSLEVVQIKVSEDFAETPNTTTYNLGSSTTLQGSGFLPLGGTS